MKRTAIVSVFSILTVSLAGAAMRAPQQPSIDPADLVLTNGKVATLDTPAEAQAVAAKGGRIVAVGSSEDIRKYAGPSTQVIDVQGQLVIPGLVEGHGHFTGVGEAALQLNLTKAASWDEIVATVEQAVKAARPGQWIYGRGRHQE